MLIALFWLGLAVVTNVFVPQLEKVAQAHNVSLSPQDAPSLQASKRIGKVFQRVRFRQCGDDRAGGRPTARCRRAPLLRRPDPKALPGHQARRAHSGFLGGSADGGRLAEQRRQGGVGAGVSRRQPGRVAVQSIRRFHTQHRGPHAAAAGGQGLCHRRRAPGHRSVRGGQPRHPEDHPDHHRGDRDDAVFALPSSHHGDSRAFHGDDRVDRVPRRRRRAGERRHHRAVDVLDQSADVAGHRGRNRLCDLHSRPLPRSAPRRAGSGIGLRDDVPGDRAHHPGFGPDDCRRGVLSDLHPAPVFPEPGHSRCNRRPRRAGGRADPGAGAAEHRPPFRSVRAHPPDAHPGLAAHRHGHRALARTHPGGDDRRGPHRSARPAGLQDELRRPPLHACQCPGQYRLRGGRAALLRRPGSIPNC